MSVFKTLTRDAQDFTSALRDANFGVIALGKGLQEALGLGSVVGEAADSLFKSVGVLRAGRNDNSGEDSDSPLRSGSTGSGGLGRTGGGGARAFGGGVRNRDIDNRRVQPGFDPSRGPFHRPGPFSGSSAASSVHVRDDATATEVRGLRSDIRRNGGLT